MHAQKWPLFGLKRGKKTLFLGYTKKMRELSITPAYRALIFSVCTQKRGFYSRISGKKSGHFCACMGINKVCYKGGRG